MKLYRSVTFNFDNAKVKLGDYWCDGVRLRKKQAVRVINKTVILARSEKLVVVGGKSVMGLITGDFEAKYSATNNLHVARARVSPNLDGVFHVTMLNASSQDIEIPPRKIIGYIYPAGEVIAKISAESLHSSISESAENDPILNPSRVGVSPREDERMKLLDLIFRYKDVFARDPKKPNLNNILKHTIDTQNALPQFKKPYRMPHAYEDEVNKQLNEMLKNEIIRPSASPWNAPVILVKKKDETLRFVCDFRFLNDVTKRDTYPLPNIQDIIDKTACSIYWSTLDAASAYWSIPLAECDKEKTAFTLPRGKYEFNVTPFGLSNAGASYQRMIDICLSGLPSHRSLAYMDDVIVCTVSFEDHLLSLASIFEKLREAGVQLKFSKCVFAREEVDFLGYNLSKEGVKPQDRLTTAIRDFKRPETKKELKGFLGLAGFYRKFVPQFAEITQPLNRLTSDNVEFRWNSDCENSFVELKRLLTSHPILAFPRIGEPFIVEVDASNHAVGGVLSQKGEGEEIHPVAYFSTTLKGSQKNWSTHSKEAFAVVMAIRHWHVYLAGTEFVIRSDHDPLVKLRSMKDPRGKFARWITELEEYKYRIEYIPGKSNIRADSLSRNRNASEIELPDDWEEKIYEISVIKNANFKSQLLEEQQSDILIPSAIKQIENGEQINKGRLKRVNKQLRVENGLLTKSGRPVVPPTLRKFIATKIHDIAHFGCKKLYEQLRERFYWSNMQKYVTVFTSNCETCQRCKADSRPPKAPLIPFHVAQCPMEFISIDIQYMPTDDQNHKYVLVIGDIFSKYIEAVPLTDQSAPQVMDALYEKWILKHSCPYFILSDQGSNVDGKIIQEICNTFHIEKRRTSSYHSQGNGFAERCIRNIREILRTTLLSRNSAQKEWNRYLQAVVFALNTSMSKAIKCVPYKVIYGRDPVLPEDLFLGLNERHTHRDVTNAVEYAEELKLCLQEVYRQVNTQLELTRAIMQRQYNKKLNFNNYEPGDRAWLKKKYYKTGENRKLSPRKTGPWTIVEKLPNGVNFRVKNDANGTIQIVRHDRLIPMKSGGMNTEVPSIPTDNEEPDDSDSESGSDVASLQSGSDAASLPDANGNGVQNRYPRRIRPQRIIEGAIPWDVINI